MKTNIIFNMQEDTCSLTDVGRVRKQNEDNLGYAETPNGDVFVVCDGMGGHVGGKVASSVAVDAIMEYFGSEKKLYITQAMDEAIRYANHKIYEKAEQEPELNGMGTTIVLTVFQEDKAYVAHVGDSRIYLFSDDKLYRVTKDHSHVQQLVDIGAITPEEAETHPRKNVILKALGTQSDVEPEVQQEPLLLKNGDVLLMCSDGLSDMVNDSTIESVLQKHENVKQAGDELMQLALNAGGKDNITQQLIKISKSNYKQTVFTDKTSKPLKSPVDTDPDKTPVPEEELIEVPEKKSFLKRILRKKFFLGAIIIFVFATGGFFGAKYLINEDESKSEEETSVKQTPVEQNEGAIKVKVFALTEDNNVFDDLSKYVNDSVPYHQLIKSFIDKDSFTKDSVKYNMIIAMSGDSILSVKQKNNNNFIVLGIKEKNAILEFLIINKDISSASKYLKDSTDSFFKSFMIHNNSIEGTGSSSLKSKQSKKQQDSTIVKKEKDNDLDR